MDNGIHFVHLKAAVDATIEEARSVPGAPDGVPDYASTGFKESFLWTVECWKNVQTFFYSRIGETEIYQSITRKIQILETARVFDLKSRTFSAEGDEPGNSTRAAYHTRVAFLVAQDIQQNYEILTQACERR